MSEKLTEHIPMSEKVSPVVLKRFAQIMKAWDQKHNLPLQTSKLGKYYAIRDALRHQPYAPAAVKAVLAIQEGNPIVE